ncbi:hypothetical protein, partial [Escherichia coli]|uniref:hypothetical protein n=1 Tax=Escherichia coli TaxID=562 RepID=UPI001BD2EB37
MDRGFGDSQSLKTTPGEHPQQPIEASHLGLLLPAMHPSAVGWGARSEPQQRLPQVAGVRKLTPTYELTSAQASPAGTVQQGREVLA